MNIYHVMTKKRVLYEIQIIQGNICFYGYIDLNT